MHKIINFNNEIEYRFFGDHIVQIDLDISSNTHTYRKHI